MITDKIFAQTFLLLSRSGALSGKMLLVSIIENNKIDAYFRAVDLQG